MDIELHEIPIKEISDGYVNDEEEGVTGFKGKLNIRPKYQRESHGGLCITSSKMKN